MPPPEMIDEFTDKELLHAAQFYAGFLAVAPPGTTTLQFDKSTRSWVIAWRNANSSYRYQLSQGSLRLEGPWLNFRMHGGDIAYRLRCEHDKKAREAAEELTSRPPGMRRL